MSKLVRNKDFQYKYIFGKISGYTTTYNAMDYPFEASIQSMLGFCDEVVVVDGCSDDGTWEKLEAMASKDDKLKLYQNPFDWTEPGIDGMQKAYARALCENEFLWQMDCDEVVHEDDYLKIKMITKRFPASVDILHLPVIELWGNQGEVTGRRHAWKWRMSRNSAEITHGINKHAKVTDEKTGKVYAREGMSDGCEYVNVISAEMLPHTGFWNEKFETVRQNFPERYAEVMNQVVETIPSVWHYSWYDLPRKVKQLKKGGVWDRMWSLLYQKESMERFPGVETDEQVKELCQKLYVHGGEDSDKLKYKFKLNKAHPALVQKWLEGR
jgi:glycosyltransferase involved in cell wall biosynthesis